MRSAYAFVPTLLILWALLFLGHNWEQGLKMDAMTNSILAKHILSTGDWKVFHYTPSGYPDYYPHPPFSIWAEALVFKLFGVSDFSARISPALFGLGTLAGVVYWGALGGSLWEGFIAALILLTSTRYIKYAADAFLEGPLAFWLVWGGIAFLKGNQFSTTGSSRVSRDKFLWSALFGICLGFAFLTKSIFAFSLPLALAASSGADFFFSKKIALRKDETLKGLLRVMVIGGISASVIVGTWFLWGDGVQFLLHHWVDIRDRVSGSQSWLEHLGPAISLARTYWPWWPLLIFCVFKMMRNLDTTPPHTKAATVFAGTLFAGFTYSGFYFEHYLVPFYPMAALAMAPTLSKALLPYRPQVEKWIFAFAVGAAVILAVFPIRLRSLHTEPLTEVLAEIPQICEGQKEILVSDQLMEKWMALAVVLWKMPTEATHVSVDSTSAQPGQLLIADKLEKPNPSIGAPVPLHSAPVSLYQPKNFTPLCR